MPSLVPIELIENMIYLIRGQKVMLDRDLAQLYGVKSFRLREQVKRNIERFPSDFMFQLNEQEVDLMVSQNAIPSKKHLGGHLPYAFTEHGALMLSSILNSKKAVDVGIYVVRAFIKLRQILSSHKELSHKLDEHEKRIQKHDVEIYSIFKAIRRLMTEPDKPKKKIGFVAENSKGQDVNKKLSPAGYINAG
jgi:hypothetical protein